MAKNYHYGVYPFIYWAISHYCFDGKHPLWVSAPFYNPLSPEATPYRLYGDLLSRISRNENAAISEWRDFLKKEVQARIADEKLTNRLSHIAENLALPFFVPLVYRVDVDALPLGLAAQGDSEGQRGTQAFQIRALEETHFEVLFADFQHEAMLKLWRSVPNTEAALQVLEANCE